ncbi:MULTISPECIES: SGNH/GDSL hydrolase family protein [unclassified Gordonia (in: high G+C Gram-positive bacteria)]
MNPGRAMLVAIAAVAALALGGGAASAVPPDRTVPPVEYVALGDSYSSASGVMPPAPGAAPLCSNSAHNYPRQVAAVLGVRVRDVSCGGADTDNLFRSRYPWVAPQLDALDARTRLVTITIGANNGDLFTTATNGCMTAHLASPGAAHPCRDRYGNSLAAEISDSTYPALVGAYQAILRAAPNARLLVLGYPQMFPAEGDRACAASLLTARGDVGYLHSAITALNAAAARAAAATGSTFVSLAEASAGHDACAGPGERWVEPIIGSRQYPFLHTNPAGQQAMARAALAVLRR